MKGSYRIIAVDPGVGRVGIAILEKMNGREYLLHSECSETSKNLPQAERLGILHKNLGSVIERFHPDGLAIETLYFSKNKKTALLVAEGRGVIMGMAGECKLPVFEYPPSQVKIAVTGYGNSDKKQIQEMVERILKLEKKSRLDDEYDAIAIGLTHLATYRSV